MTITWDDLREQASSAEDQDSILAVIGRFHELQEDDGLNTDTVIANQFNTNNRAAEIGLILMDKHISLNQGANLFEGKFFDKLLNAMAGHDVSAQMVIGMGERLDSFKDAMKQVGENFEISEVAFFFDYLDCYLDDEAKSNAEVSTAINNLVRSYQDASQYFYDSSLIDEESVMIPYKAFGDILDGDVRERVSKQILTTSERSAELAAIHLLKYNSDKPKYAELAQNITLDGNRLLSEDADLDMKLVGIGDMVISVPNHALHMIDHVMPEDEQQALRAFAFAIEYCNIEWGVNSQKYQDWQIIFQDRLQKTLTSDHQQQESLPAGERKILAHNPLDD